jgi:hypothetical protein
MGRQARLKQLKQKASGKPSQEVAKPLPDFDQTQFVQQLKRQGYDLDLTKSCPEIPDSNRPSPQL